MWEQQQRKTINKINIENIFVAKRKTVDSKAYIKSFITVEKNIRTRKTIRVKNWINQFRKRTNQQVWKRDEGKELRIDRNEEFHYSDEEKLCPFTLIQKWNSNLERRVENKVRNHWEEKWRVKQGQKVKRVQNQVHNLIGTLTLICQLWVEQKKIRNIHSQKTIKRSPVSINLIRHFEI